MAETPEERRERLAAALAKGYAEGRHETPDEFRFALDSLLDALEPPVAEMVRRGVVARRIERHQFTYWYRPS